MAYTNTFATHPGKKAEDEESLNEDFAHAWVNHDVLYQVVADGNKLIEDIGPAAFCVNEIQRFIERYSESKMSIHEIKRMMAGAVFCANRTLLSFKKANSEQYNQSVFSSLTMCAITKNNDFAWVHTGDSRLYIIRNEKIIQITKDHTVAQKLCSENKIKKEQIALHPDRNTLTSALGFDEIVIDDFSGKLSEKDIIMLTTDGVYKVLSNEQILEIIMQSGTCESACEGIVEVANICGGPDNMSVCIAYAY